MSQPGDWQDFRVLGNVALSKQGTVGKGVGYLRVCLKVHLEIQ